MINTEFKAKTYQGPGFGQMCVKLYFVVPGGCVCVVLDSAFGVANRSEDEWLAESRSMRIAKRARKLLEKAGIPEEDTRKLFAASACSICHDNSNKDASHAECGVRGIRDFMAVHTDKLKATMIEATD